MCSRRSTTRAVASGWSARPRPPLAYPIDPFLAAGRPRPATRRRAVDEHRVDQYEERLSVSFQQALPWRLVGQISYLGNQGHHMLDRCYVDLDGSGNRNGRCRRSDGSNQVERVEHEFNGLQLSLQRPFQQRVPDGRAVHVVACVRRGLARRRRIDRAAERRVPELGYGSTNQDIRHTLTVELESTQLPFGEGRRQ